MMSDSIVSWNDKGLKIFTAYQTAYADSELFKYFQGSELDIVLEALYGELPLTTFGEVKTDSEIATVLHTLYDRKWENALKSEVEKFELTVNGDTKVVDYDGTKTNTGTITDENTTSAYNEDTYSPKDKSTTTNDLTNGDKHNETTKYNRVGNLSAIRNLLTDSVINDIIFTDVKKLTVLAIYK